MKVSKEQGTYLNLEVHANKSSLEQLITWQYTQEASSSSMPNISKENLMRYNLAFNFGQKLEKGLHGVLRRC